jgi:hypothetical protein
VESVLLWYLEFNPTLGQRILDSLENADIRALSLLGSNELNLIFSTANYRQYFYKRLTTPEDLHPTKWERLFQSAQSNSTFNEAILPRAYELLQLSARALVFEAKIEKLTSNYQRPITFETNESMTLTKQLFIRTHFDLNCSVGWVFFDKAFEDERHFLLSRITFAEGFTLFFFGLDINSHR